MTKDELAKVIDLHAKWLRGDADGVMADLRGADLSDAELRGAKLPRVEELANALEATQVERDTIWAEATAAAYGAAAAIAHEGALATEDDGVAAWVRDRIKAQTPQSARDWLAEHDRDIVEHWHAKVCDAINHVETGEDAELALRSLALQMLAVTKADKIRALPIKEKGDE